MTTAIERQEDGTIVLTITIGQKQIQDTKEAVVIDMVKQADLPGFRKGKAPRKLVEEKLDQAKVREEVLKKLLPQAYIETVKEHNLQPIINPRIHVEKLEEGKDWQFTASTCEAPKVDLDNYKDAVQKVTAKSKIVIPGKEPQQPKFEEIMEALLGTVKVTVPKILIEQEVERLLSQLLDEIKRLGLTLDQYLSSTGKTTEVLRDEYAKKAEGDIKLEFTLQQIAEAEKITVESKEIDEAIQKAKDDKERKHLEANRYLLTNILRQQKTLDFLRKL